MLQTKTILIYSILVFLSICTTEGYLSSIFKSNSAICYPLIPKFDSSSTFHIVRGVRSPKTHAALTSVKKLMSQSDDASMGASNNYGSDKDANSFNCDKSLDGLTPTSIREGFNLKSNRLINSAAKFAAVFGLGLLPVPINRSPAKAIGSLYELRDQRMCLQDISLNVVDTALDTKLFTQTFQETCKLLKNTRTKDGKSVAILGFGPNSYQSPKDFYPGVSSFFGDGGHATITLNSQSVGDDDSGVTEIFEPGNGLQYIRIATDSLRLSKALEADAKLKYAYGWVDLETPGGVPLEIVVGVARDPLMMASLRVSNIEESVKFFEDVLGMSKSPYRYARTPGSDFEPQPPKGSVYLSYGPESMGLLISVPQAPKRGSPPLPSLKIGSQLNAFSIVVDDSDAAFLASLSPAIQEAIENKSIVRSPDGYPFSFQKLSAFESTAVNKVE